MATAKAIDDKRDNQLKKALANKDDREKKIKEKYEESMAKIQEIYDKSLAAAADKYNKFVAEVNADIEKRLRIVRKVIDAEAAERLARIKAIKEAELSKLREQAEIKMREEAERVHKEQLRLEAKKKKKAAAKAKRKQMKKREKVPLPNPGGTTTCSKSSVLYKKLKKLSSAGRYAFCCFYHPAEKKYAKYFAELATEFYTNVAWFDCPIKDQNFTEAMLLYEFNATPAVVVCFEGKPSNLHRYIIGDTPDNRDCLKRYAEKADAE